MSKQEPGEGRKLTYDIFRKFAGDGPIWIESVYGIEKCRLRLVDLVQKNQGEFFAFDPLHSQIVANSTECRARNKEF